MNNLLISQTESVSSLPKNYSLFLKRAKKKNEPIIFLKRNRPVGALVSWELLEELMDAKTKFEKMQAMSKIAQSEKEYKQGKGKVLKSLFDLK
jgi:PHD/YefM family antitoxin component YafN of YafNO toxin-antitoxin module